METWRYAEGVAYQTHRKGQGAASGTIRREWAVLMRILNLAVKNRQLDANPFLGVSMPKGTRRQRVSTVAELLAIQAQAFNELWQCILFALNTGLRLGNVFHLQREWISETGFWLIIPAPRSSLKQHPTKVPLNALALEATPGVGEGRVWSWKNIRSLKKAWTLACRKAGVADLHFHDLRHTFATRLKGLGVGYEVRQALLGHAMRGETAMYSHGSPAWDEQLREAVVLLDMDWRKEGLTLVRHRSATEHSNVVGLERYKYLKDKEKKWSGKGDLNPRPSPWQGARLLRKTKT